MAEETQLDRIEQKLDQLLQAQSAAEQTQTQGSFASTELPSDAAEPQGS